MIRVGVHDNVQSRLGEWLGQDWTAPSYQFEAADTA